MTRPIDVMAHPVASGRLITLAEFAWASARSYGFLEPAPVRATPEPAPRPDDPDEAWVDEVRELNRLRALSTAAAAVAQAEDTIARWRGWSSIEVARTLALSRVEKMQDQLDAWFAPHPPLRDLKERMGESLAVARRNLARVEPPNATTPDVAVWLSDRIERQDAAVKAAWEAMCAHRAATDRREQVRAGLETCFGDPPAPVAAVGEPLTPNGYPLDRTSGNL